MKGENGHYSTGNVYWGATDAYWSQGNCGTIKVEIHWWTDGFWVWKSAQTGSNSYIYTSTTWATGGHFSRHFAYTSGFALQVS